MKIEKILSGILIGLAVGAMWRSQRNPPKISLGETRIHHYQTGAAMAALGILFDKPLIGGIGTGLFLDDIDDVL